MKKTTAWIITLVVWLLGAIILIIHPFVPDLPISGHWVLAGLFLALPMWIVMPGGIPRSIAGLLMLGFLLFGSKLPFGAIFGGFADPALWTLIPAFAFGYVLTKTGLGRRLALYVLRTFPLTKVGLAIAWIIIGVVLSALTPSIIVRIAIVMPLVVSFLEILRIPDRSPQAAFISMLAFVGATIPGNGWLTGSLAGLINMGFLPHEMRAGIDWSSYTVSQIIPWLIIVIVLLIYIFIFFRPGSFQGVKEQINKEYQNLGSISSHERITLIILMCCFLGFITTPWHHVGSAAICLIGFFLLYVFNVMEAKDIATGVNWDLILFIGSALSIAPIFKVSGVGEWLCQLISPCVASLSANAWVFVLVLTLIGFLMRFIDVAFGLPTAALILALTPVYSQFGIHPLVACTISSVVQLFFFFTYQSSFAIIANSMTQNRGWSDKQLMVGGVGYVVAVVISMSISVFYWRSLGLI